MIAVPPSKVDQHGNRLFWSDQLGKHVTVPGAIGRLGECRSYPVSIFVAGRLFDAGVICRTYCDDVGLCVTLTPTEYLYTGGMEAGVIVGLINYPRFPTTPEAIFAKAEELAHRLIEGLSQQSATIQAPDKTVWIGMPRDSDGSGEAGETRSDSTEGDSAGRTSGIAKGGSHDH